MLVFAIAVTAWIIFSALMGIPLTWPAILTFVLLSTVAPVRRAQELFTAQVVVGAVGVGCVLPAALIVDDVELWIVCGVAGTLSLGIAATVFLRRHRDLRRERRWAQRPVRVWLTLPHGQDIPLDVRPFRCGTCERVHHVAFAEHQPRSLPMFVTVLIEGTRGEVLLAIVTGEDGQPLLTAAPADFDDKQWTGEYTNHPGSA